MRGSLSNLAYLCFRPRGSTVDCSCRQVDLIVDRFITDMFVILSCSTSSPINAWLFMKIQIPSCKKPISLIQILPCTLNPCETLFPVHKCYNVPFLETAPQTPFSSYTHESKSNIHFTSSFGAPEPADDSHACCAGVHWHHWSASRCERPRAPG